MKKILLLFAAALGSVSSILAQASPLGGGVSCPNGYSTSLLFSFAGTTETFTVPAGVTSLHITAIAPTGGDGAYNGTVGTSAAPGGYGGQVSGFLAVTPGDVLYITVGQRGQDAVAGGTMVANAFNGGGRGGPTGAGGSGATDIRRGGTSLTNRIMVAGGGGGAGANGCSGSAGSGYHSYGGRGGNADAAGSNGETSTFNGSPITGGIGGLIGGSAAPGVGCAGFPGSAGNINGNGGAGPSFNACTTGGANGGGGGGGYIQGGGGGGGAVGTTGCSGNVTSGGGGGAGGSNYISGDFTTTNTTLTASTTGGVIICYPPPVIMPVVSNVTYNGTPCVGATTTLTASGSLGSASDWGWYYNGSFQSYGPTFTFTVPNASSALIQVRGEGGTVGTSASFYDYTMAFYANPTANVNPASGTYCGDVTQVATGGATYVWSNGSTSASNTVIAPNTQTQSVTVTDANGCTASTTTNVLAYPAIFASATFDSSTGVLTATATGGNGNYTYEWSLGGGAIPGTNSVTYTATVNGVYAVLVSDTDLVCSSNSTVVVTGVGVDNINTATFSMSPNPTTGVLVLDNLTIGKNFRLVNALGQLVKSFEATSTQMTLDISAQPAGTYFLQSEGQALSIVKQ